MNKKGQGTIEYLIIIAIVVVIALVVVGLLTGFFATGSGVGETQQQISQQTQQIGLIEKTVSPDGNFLLELRSNESGTITINRITIGSSSDDYNSNNRLNLGETKLFQVTTGVSCTEGTNQTVESIVLTYIGSSGITRNYTYSNITASCQNYSISSTADIAGKGSNE